MTKIRRMAAGLALGALVTSAAAACTQTAPPTGRASGKTPVVLIHGYVEGTSVWGPMINGLKAAGYTDGDITNFGYDTTSANSGATVSAAKLAAAVRKAISSAKANGNPTASKVDIVSHSYGSMVTRHCIELGPCTGLVDHWMSLAGADGGTQIASIPQALGQGSGRDMAIDSAEVRTLKAPENVQKLEDQGVKVEVQWTPNDGVINPPRNSLWPSPENPDPAANKQVSGALNHLNIFDDPGVIAETIAFFGR